MDAESTKMLAAALAIGIGGTGSSLAEGYIAGKALEAMARNPEMSDKFFTNGVIFMAIAESVAIYSLVVSLILLFVI